MLPLFKQQRIETLRQRAWGCVAAQDFASAVAAFAAWRDLTPESAEVWFGLGWCNAIVQGEARDKDFLASSARQPLETALELHARSGGLEPQQVAGAHLQLGLLWSLGGQREEEIRHFRMTVEAAPRSRASVLARVKLAGRACDDSDWDAAEHLFAEALAVDPSHIEATRRLAWVRERRKSLTVLFEVRSGLLFERFPVVVQLDETLGEIAARVLPERYGLPLTGGRFLDSGDNALPLFLYHETHQTVRELGIHERDVVSYFALALPPGVEEAVQLIRSAEKLQAEDLGALRREVEWILSMIASSFRRRELERAETLAGAVLRVDPDNAAAADWRTRVQTAIRERDAGSAAADGTSWSHSHGGASRTGQAVHGPVPPLRKIWEIETGEAGVRPPVVADGRVYAAVGRDLRCHDAVFGEERWRRVELADLEGSPVVAGDCVYAADGGGISAHDARTGRALWRHEAMRPRSPALVDGRLYLVDSSGSIHCLEARTGEPIAAVATGAEDLHGLAVEGSRAVAASGREVVCADLCSGRVLWRRQGRFEGTIPVVAHGGVFLGTFEEGLWCLDATSGRFRWLFATDAWISAAPSVARGRVFFVDTGGRFACLEVLTGELIWTPSTWVTDHLAGSTAPVVAGPWVYMLLDDGVLYCLDVVSGAEVWRGEAETWQGGVATLAVTSAAIYYATPAGKVVCLGSAPKGANRGVTAALPIPPSLRSIQSPPAAPKGPSLKHLAYPGDSSLSHQETAELHRAVVLMSHQRADEAIAALRHLQREHPDEGIVLHNLATAYDLRGFLGDALATLDHLLELDPGNLLAFKQMSEILRANPGLTEAIYGPPEPVDTPQAPEGPRNPKPGLTPFLSASGATLLCLPETAADSLRYATVWYWWQLFATPHGPVLRLHLELAYPAAPACVLRLPLNAGDSPTQSWLDRLLAGDAVPLDVYSMEEGYRFSRRLPFPPEHRDRVRGLVEQARRVLATLTPHLRDFRAAVVTVEAAEEQTKKEIRT